MLQSRSPPETAISVFRSELEACLGAGLPGVRHLSPLRDLSTLEIAIKVPVRPMLNTLSVPTTDAKVGVVITPKERNMTRVIVTSEDLGAPSPVAVANEDGVVGEVFHTVSCVGARNLAWVRLLGQVVADDEAKIDGDVLFEP